MKYCVIGEKLTHSMSPQIHKQYFDSYNLDGEYTIRQIPMEEMLGDCKDILLGYDGFNVTVPYKEKVMKYLTDISEEAKSIGAVNTVVNSRGSLYGYNTDPYGFASMLEVNGIAIKDKTFVVLGSGGASKSVRYILKKLGAKSVAVATRDCEKGKSDGYVTYDELENYKADALVNTTPVGMFPNVDGIPVSESVISNFNSVVDVVYNPVYTKLLQTAVRLGKKAVGGLYMLVAQAMKSQEIWNGKATDAALTKAIYNTLMKEYFAKEGGNIYLTGIMSCGKSVKGRRVAQKLGWEFVDADKYIEEIAGESVAQMFEKGEEYFRNWESEALFRLSQRKNLVVATGGGAILKDVNVSAMKLSGIIVLIERNVDDIIANVNVSTRPLLKNGADKLRKIYDDRKNKYYSTCDVVVTSCENDINKTVDDIIKVIK
ncbi:MAG: hypothetical protein K2G37_03640 [Clostridia bacterium]|nr:hypothetical protein [Clostridia bacterium]MDE7328377.1 hypothetical protein [Clostridia bacterium]